MAAVAGDPNDVGARDALQQPVFSAKTVGVRVDVLVTDSATGKPAGGLTASDFEVRDNGVIQRIDSVDFGDMAVNVGLALDVSGSTAGTTLADLQAATYQLLDLLQAADRVSLTTFDRAVAPRVPLTSSFHLVKTAIAALTPSGETSLLEGIYVALAGTLAEPGRSFLVVFTDERDTASWLRSDDLFESARHSNAVIYVVASRSAIRWTPLREICAATGGRLIGITSSAQIANEFRTILRDFRSRYVLAYTPTGVRAEGFHQLKVDVKRDHLTVTARTGYFGERPHEP